MNCKEAHQFLADYLDGALPWRQRMSLSVHLMLCRHCRRYLATYAATIRLAKSLGEPADPVEQPVPEALVQAILAVQRRRGRTTDEK
jgi:predicted anti-sigma-YlaC factor YlaD